MSDYIQKCRSFKEKSLKEMCNIYYNTRIRYIINTRLYKKIEIYRQKKRQEREKELLKQKEERREKESRMEGERVIIDDDWQ